MKELSESLIEQLELEAIVRDPYLLGEALFTFCEDEEDVAGEGVSLLIDACRRLAVDPTLAIAAAFSRRQKIRDAFSSHQAIQAAMKPFRVPFTFTRKS